LPPQPPPVKNQMQGNRSGTRRLPSGRDRYCKQFLREDGQDDVFAILGCLQTNRGKISNSCQQVLASHGQ